MNERQRQELQEAEEADIFDLLTRVQERCGLEIALRIASHLGYTNEFLKYTRKTEAA